MLKLGFKAQWVDLVMRCVKSASFLFLINGCPSGHILPSRGICQGDPLSPLLFLFCSEGLTGLIAYTIECGTIRGYRICPNAPVVLHLLFVDDTIIFCGADHSQVETFKSILHFMSEPQAKRLTSIRLKSLLVK